MNTFGHVGLFASLYFIQGCVLAFFNYFHKPMLFKNGLTSQQIGLIMTVIMLPFIFKIFFGLLSDSVSFLRLGYRRPYMILGLLLASLGFFLVSNISSQSSYYSYMALIFIATTGLALFDSATDGYALDIVHQKDYSFVQTAMICGKALGIIILSHIFGRQISIHGTSHPFLILSFICGLPLFFFFLIPRSPTPQKERLKLQDFHFFFNKGHLLFLFYAVLYSFFSFGQDGLVTYYLKQQFNLGDTQIGLYGSFKGIGSIIGALMGGLIIRFKGIKMASYLAVFLLLLGELNISDSLAPDNVKWVGILWGSSWGFQETVYVTLAMLMASTKIPAMSFAFFMVMSNLGTTLAEGVLTSLVDSLGFSRIFTFIQLGTPLLFILLFYLHRYKKKGLS